MEKKKKGKGGKRASALRLRGGKNEKKGLACRVSEETTGKSKRRTLSFFFSLLSFEIPTEAHIAEFKKKKMRRNASARKAVRLTQNKLFSFFFLSLTQATPVHAPEDGVLIVRGKPKKKKEHVPLLSSALIKVEKKKESTVVVYIV